MISKNGENVVLLLKFIILLGIKMNIENCCIVIFGVLGDLIFCKFIFVFYNLYKVGRLGEYFLVFGVVCMELNDE